MKIKLVVSEVQNGTKQAIADHLQDYIDMFLEYNDSICCLCQECIEREEEWECSQV